MLQFYIIYSLIVSFITFVLFAYDKIASQKKIFRIPENVLLLFISVGGSIGGLLGMYGLRHKTIFKTKFHFAIGAVIALIVQIVILSLILVLKYEY